MIDFALPFDFDGPLMAEAVWLGFQALRRKG
jgi:hypothetical protein